MTDRLDIIHCPSCKQPWNIGAYIDAAARRREIRGVVEQVEVRPGRASSNSAAIVRKVTLHFTDDAEATVRFDFEDGTAHERIVDEGGVIYERPHTIPKGEADCPHCEGRGNSNLGPDYVCPICGPDATPNRPADERVN